MKITYTRSLAVFALLAALLVSGGVLAGCGKKAPVLPPQVLAAGVVPQKHPVSQEKARAMGCSCHVEAAKKAGQ